MYLNCRETVETMLEVKWLTWKNITKMCLAWFNIWWSGFSCRLQKLLWLLKQEEISYEGVKCFLNPSRSQRRSQSWPTRAAAARIHPESCWGSCCHLCWSLCPRLTSVSLKQEAAARTVGWQVPQSPVIPQQQSWMPYVPCVLTQCLTQISVSMSQW